MPRKRTSPETDLAFAAERLVVLAGTILDARRPNLTGRRVDSAAVRTIVAGAVGEIVTVMDAHLKAVLAVGAEVGMIDPAKVAS